MFTVGHIGVDVEAEVAVLSFLQHTPEGFDEVCAEERVLDHFELCSSPRGRPEPGLIHESVGVRWVRPSE